MALTRFSFVIHNLKYMGKDGSLGYRNGEIYSLRVGVNEKEQIVICRLDYEGINIYETERIFSVLWKGQTQIIRKIKLLKINIESV